MEKALKIALPSGKLLDSTLELLKKSGISISVSDRNCKPKSSLKNLRFYIIKPRDIPQLVSSGMMDVGIVGLDLILDSKCKTEILLDLKTMPVYLVVAGRKPYGKLKNARVAAEYANIAKRHFKSKNIKIIKTHGSTECFVPDFADAVVVSVQTGATLKQNNLKVFGVIMKSTTRMISNTKSLKERKSEIALLKRMLERGMKKMDLRYNGFLTEGEVKASSFR